MTVQIGKSELTQPNSVELEHTKQYFTFMLADEEYGFDILSVLEIRGLDHMTALPSAPNYIKGVINLRGTIIPTMDLRERFNIKSIPYNRSTVLIVVQITTEQKKKVVGVIVDSVSDVYSISQQDIQPKPEIYHNAGHEYIAGLVSVQPKNEKQKLVILLDVNKLFDVSEFESLTINHKNSHEKN